MKKPIKQFSFQHGLHAPPFKEQFPELPDNIANYLDTVNKAITHLLFAGCITDSQNTQIRQKKFPRLVDEMLNKHMPAEVITEPDVVET